jgi:hypothetical protein
LTEPYFVTSSFIVPALGPLVLQILCLIGFGAGVVLFVSGLRRRHGQIESPVLSDRELPVQNRQSQPEPRTSRSTTPVEVIRLPQDSSPAKSTGMTQQQKIAAALQKAGIPNSVGWENPEVEEDGASSIQVAAAVTAHAEDVTPKDGSNPKVANSHGRNILMISAGAALALLSLYLFLRL